MDMHIDPVEEILKQFDRSSPDRLLRSIASEMLRLREAIARCEDRVTAIESEPALPPELPRGVLIDAAQAPGGVQGFYQLEHNAEGEPMRWTGPSPDFCFRFAIDRAGAIPFALRFLKFYAPTEPPELRAETDGVELVVAVEKTAHGFVARGHLPAGAGATTLRFTCPRVGSPQDEGYDDDRTLGLLFLRLEAGGSEETDAGAATVARAFG